MQSFRVPDAFVKGLLTNAIVIVWLLFLGNSTAIAQEEKPSVDRRLQNWLAKYPNADANGDGVLTESEARVYKKTSKSGKTEDAKKSGREKTSTATDVSYGPHERNVLDLWQAPSEHPTPVLIFFHGGSFKAGDKSRVQDRPIFEECLAAGISVVSANYRFSSDAPFPASMHDGARAVQFVRSRAKDWNIDPENIALSGSSAGATLALWIALHDDLADPNSADPIAQVSTRVACACPHSGTAGLEFEYFKQHAGVTKLGGALWQLFGANSQADFESAEKKTLQREASPLHHATSDDPPLFLTYAGKPSEAPFAADATQKDWIHHVCLGLPLKARYDALGKECEIYHQAKPAASDAEIAFLKRHLLKTARKVQP